jgi:hypothetical protein
LVTPALDTVGTTVATSATGVVDAIQPALEVLLAGSVGYDTSCLV